MLGLTVHNFLSAATGLAMAFALIRGFSRATSPTVGNFWVDMTRATLYILLPLSIVVAIALAMLGAPQTFTALVEATTLEGAKQVISIGPVASQEAIKELGTNGGGFFNANSAHPFENPNAISNMLRSGRCWSFPSRRCSPLVGRSATSGRDAPSSSPCRSCSASACSSPIGRKRAAIRC